MASIDDLCKTQRRELLKWAVVEHYRTWLCFDGPELECVRKNGQKLGPKSVQKIAGKYSVMRSSPEGTSKPKMAENIAGLLGGEIETHPDDLLERAYRCVWLAREAKRLEYLTKFEPSGMTKLMWFIKPKGWTIYDDFAATAVGSKGKTTIDRMKQFYMDLSERGFVKSANNIQTFLSNGGLSQLYGERVIDKFLWLRGAGEEKSDATVEECRAYLNGLCNGIGDQLEGTARAISVQCAPSLQALEDNA